MSGTKLERFAIVAVQLSNECPLSPPYAPSFDNTPHLASIWHDCINFHGFSQYAAIIKSSQIAVSLNEPRYDAPRMAPKLK